MRRFTWGAFHADTPTRRPLTEAILAALYVDGDPPAGGGAAAPVAAAPVVAAAPAAAAPVVDGGEKPAPAAAAPKPDGNIVGDAKPAAATAAEQRAYLIEHTSDGKTDAGKKTLEGKTDEEVAKLYDALKKEEGKAKPADGAVKPEDIQLKMPEGITIDDKQLTELKGILADAKLTPAERGQKLVDMHAAAIKDAANQPYLLWDKTQKEWQDTVKSDAELGGQNFEPMKASIAKLIDSVGGKEAEAIRQAFNFTGAGNNPDVIRLLYRAAKALTEGTHVGGSKPAPDGQRNPASVLYPNQANPPLANAGR